MSQRIDATVEGNPGAIRALAVIFKDEVGPAVNSAGDSLAHARHESGDTWVSDAGDAFHATVSEQILPVDDLGAYMDDAAGTLDHLAGELEQCQRLMEGICRDAASAGLAVDGFIIHHPGPALARPGPLPADADAATAEVHRQHTEACVAQDAKLDAYTRAAHEASEVRTKEENAARSMGATVSQKQKLRLVFNAAELGAVTTAALQAEIRGLVHRRKVNTLLKQARELGRKRRGTTGFEARQAISRERSDVLSRAWRHRNSQWDLYKQQPRIKAIGGGVFAGAGFVYDVTVLERPWHEAAVSGGVGLGASIGAGALVGTVIPVPVLGTLAGAGFGAAAGIFASSAVDDLFANPESGVGEAVSAGWSTVTSTWDSLF